MAEEGKLYIGNLPYKVSEDDLRDAFEKYGEVEDVNIIMDRDTGRAKGFAFVTFRDENDARDAIDGLDKSEMEGRDITVNKARPRTTGGGGSRSGGGGGGGGSYGGGGGGRSGGYGGGGRHDGGGGGRHDGGGGGRYDGGGGGRHDGGGGGGGRRSGGYSNY